MYNRLYKYLCQQKLLYSKQFGFQKGHSTDHVTAHIVDQINESFENDNYTLQNIWYCQSFNIAKKTRKNKLLKW